MLNAYDKAFVVEPNAKIAMTSKEQIPLILVPIVVKVQSSIYVSQVHNIQLSNASGCTLAMQVNRTFESKRAQYATIAVHAQYLYHI